MNKEIFTNKNENFKITCKKCNSDNTETGHIYFRDFSGKLSSMESVIVCKSCGVKDNI